MSDVPERDENAVFAILHEEQFVQHFIELAETIHNIAFRDVLTAEQFRMIIEEHGNRDETGRLCFSLKTMHAAIQSVFKLFVDCGLAKMAAAGDIECAFDAEKNDFVFWRNDGEDKNATK